MDAGFATSVETTYEAVQTYHKKTARLLKDLDANAPQDAKQGLQEAVWCLGDAESWLENAVKALKAQVVA